VVPSSATPVGREVTASQASLLRLQRLAGNAAVVRRVAETPAKTKTMEEELYDPSLLDFGEKGVDKAVAESDLKVLRVRLARIPALAKTDFFDFMRAYVDAAVAGQAGLALENMYSALACLDSVGAFTVDGALYARLGETPNPKVLAAARARAMQNVHLWSKLDKYHSIDTVKGGASGLTLESSAAGSLFDGLSFGMDYKTNKVLGQQWKLVSKTFVSQASGVVHAQVLEGIDETSVLFTTEWPEIKQLIAEGKVLHLVVHFFEFDKGENGRPGELREVGHQVVWTQAQFDALKRVSSTDDAEYGKRQGATYGSEEARFDRTAGHQAVFGRYRKQFSEARARLEAALTGGDPGSTA
jgi:hypothetical protein